MQRRPGPTLAERGGLPAPAAAPPESEAPRRRVVMTRHCWVTGLPDRPGRWAGLLVEWRQADTGEWLGRVAYVVDEDSRPVLVEAWLPGRQLGPA